LSPAVETSSAAFSHLRLGGDEPTPAGRPNPTPILFFLRFRVPLPLRRSNWAATPARLTPVPDTAFVSRVSSSPAARIPASASSTASCSPPLRPAATLAAPLPVAAGGAVLRRCHAYKPLSTVAQPPPCSAGSPYGLHGENRSGRPGAAVSCRSSTKLRARARGRAAEVRQQKYYWQMNFFPLSRWAQSPIPMGPSLTPCLEAEARWMKQERRAIAGKF